MLVVIVMMVVVFVSYSNGYEDTDGIGDVVGIGGIGD